MIKFFRNIRRKYLAENRFSKYLLYAIGEIILVVIGILIALQINNWNEERKENLHVTTIYSNLLRDIRADSVSYNLNLKKLRDIDILHEQLYKAGIQNDTTIILKHPSLLRYMIYYNPITKENDPFIASKITNDSIRKEVLIYFRNMKDMDDVYSELEGIIKNKMRVYLGSKKMYKLTNWFENRANVGVRDSLSFEFINHKELIELSKEPEFQQILFEASLKNINSKDILEILIRQNARLIKVIELEMNKS